MVDFAEEKLKFKRGMALVVSLIFFLVFTVITLLWFIPNIIDSFEEIIDKFPAFQDRFNEYLEKVFIYLREKNLLLLDGEEIKQEIQNFFVNNMNNIKNILISVGLNVIDWVMEIFIIFFGSFSGTLFYIRQKIFYGLYKKYNIYFLRRKGGGRRTEFFNRMQEYFS